MFILIKPNRKLTSDVYSIEQQQQKLEPEEMGVPDKEDWRLDKWYPVATIYRRKVLTRKGGEPLHGVRSSTGHTKSGVVTRHTFYFDFHIFAAVNLRVGRKEMKRTEIYVNRFNVNYISDRYAEPLADEFLRYWKLNQVDTSGMTSRELDNHSKKIYDECPRIKFSNHGWKKLLKEKKIDNKSIDAENLIERIEKYLREEEENFKQIQDEIENNL